VKIKEKRMIKRMKKNDQEKEDIKKKIPKLKKKRVLENDQH